MRFHSLPCLVALALALQADRAAAAPSLGESFRGVLAAELALSSAAGTRVTGLAGWSVKRDGKLTVLEAPERDARLTMVDSGPAAPGAAGAGAALAAAWARTGGARPQSPLRPAPARGGWDESWIAGDALPADAPGKVHAMAFRRGKNWSVLIVDGSTATLGKRSAAIERMRASVAPRGYEPENFAGRTPLPLSAARIARLQAFLQQAMRDAGVPGLSFALVEGGKVIHESGLGVRELGKPARVDAHTLFMAASNTKAMSSMMLATLADQGKLRWDQPVRELYPRFKLGTAPTTAQVQLRHLVCACTGMPRQDLEWMFEYRHVTPAGSLAMLGKNSPTSGFGEVFQYNNLMASAAGYIGASLAYPSLELGKAYDRAMQERIFDPLGMASTTFDTQRAQGGNHAAPHATGYDNQLAVAPFAMNRSIYPLRPAGGVWTSAHDFARYVLLEAGDGKLDGKQLVSAANVLARRQPQIATGKDETYGMGLATVRVSGVDVLEHGGSLFGYKSNFMVLPGTGVGAVILTNSDQGSLLLLPFRRRLLELLFDGKPEAAEDLKVAAARAEQARSAASRLLATPPAASLVRGLARRYRSPELGEVWIRRQGVELILDAGEWQTALAGRRNEGGGESLVTLSPVFPGVELAPGMAGGKRTLTVRDAEHAYRFVEVK